MMRLDRLVTLEDPQRTADGAGGFAESHAALGRIWVRIDPRTPRIDGDAAVARAVVRLRRSPEGSPAYPRADQRLRDGARIWRIETVTEDPADDRLLLCHAVEESAR